MIALNKISWLSFLLLLLLNSCTTEPKSSAVNLAPPSTLPLEMLTGSWEVSDAVRNGKNTTALEGIYFTFTEDEKLISNFNLSLEERTAPYKMSGDTLITLGSPNHAYLIQSLSEEEVVLRTKMENFFFRLTLATKVELPEEKAEES